MDFLINSAYAQAAGTTPAGPSLISSLALPALLLVVFYFLLIRPQSKRAKEQREMLSKVAVGDEIATTGGILGKVTEVGDQFLSVEISDGVNIKLQKFRPQVASQHSEPLGVRTFLRQMKTQFSVHKPPSDLYWQNAPAAVSMQ